MGQFASGAIQGQGIVGGGDESIDVSFFAKRADGVETAGRYAQERVDFINV
jgi:hypothetical protein